MENKLFLLTLIIIVASALVADSSFVVRFDNPTSQITNTFTENNYDIAAYKPGEFLDIVVTQVEYQELLTQGYEVVITQTEQQMKNNLKGLTDLDGYIDYEQMLAELQQIELDYPNICKLYDIGESRGKQYSDAGNPNYDDYYHEIWAMKVSDNVETEEDEPSIYYLSEHHAREPISLEVNMAILNHIIDNYGTDPEITENVNNTQIWFVPLVNPNGHKIVTDEIELMWRKNICDNNENGTIDVSGYYAQDGTDPNRNYGWEWGGASTDWTSYTYQGTSAFSEPETQAIEALVENHHFVAGISYHSYSELVLYPFGYADGVVAPDQAALEELATDMAVTIPSQYGGNYTPEAAWELYPCTGTTDDYSYGTHGIFSFTIELATEFIPPAGQVAGICDDNIEAAMILLDRVNGSILTGHITDSDTDEPIANAIVAIQDFVIASVTTNAIGEYTIEDLYEFNYSFAVYSPVHAGLLEQHIVTASNNEIDFELFAMPDGTFENGEYESSWNLTGNNNWVIDDATVYSGVYSAKSGEISDDQTSSLSISLFVQDNSEISFYQKVSSETDYDYLRFYIDNTLQDSWSGNGNWEFETFDVVSGFHTFKWEYYKDGGVSSFQDCVWIDEITFPENSVEVTPDENSMIKIAEFNGNYPNPFNPTTTFNFCLASESKVSLTLFNIKGQKIKTLVNENQTAGIHQVIWDGTDDHGKKVSTGIYFSHCDAHNEEGDYTSVKKVILLK